MTDAEAAAIAARAEAATPGPWTLPEFYKPGDTDAWTWAEIRSGEEHVTGNFDYENGGVIKEADAHFIAHARADIPALLAERAALREIVRMVVRAVDETKGGLNTMLPWHNAIIEQARALLEGKQP